MPPYQLPSFALEDGGAFHGHQSEQILVAAVESSTIEQLGGKRLGGCFHILEKFDDREEFRLSFR